MIGFAETRSLMGSYASAACAAAALVVLLSAGKQPALAQASGSGSGGSEQRKAPKSNTKQALARKSRVDVKSMRGRPRPLVDGIFNGPGLSGATLSVSEKGIVTRLSSADLVWRVGGRLHLDSGIAGADSRAFASAFQETLIRRAFIESYVTVADKIEAAFQYDTAPSDPQPLQDAGISYRGPGPFMLSLGNLKEPMGFDQLTSDNDTLFLERALPTALTPGRNFGGLAGINGEQWTLVAGVWGGDPNTGLADEGVSGTARATFAPILTAEQVLHLGLSGSYRVLDRVGDRFGFETTVASTPETNLLPISRALVNTGPIAGAIALNRLGLEFGYQYGSLRLQGEAARQTVIRAAYSNVTFASYYAEAGWILNGEGRPYRIKPSYGSEYAEFGGIEIGNDQCVTRGGIGVFEIAARVSAIDLSDRDIRGGSEQDFTLGVNWYPERNVKLMGNYIRVNAAPNFERGPVKAGI